MCNYKSAIVLQDLREKGGYRLLMSPWTESHSELEQIFKLREGCRLTFAKVEFSPDDLSTADQVETYQLKIDEERTPEWFDDEIKTSVISKMSAYISSTIVTGDVSLLIGGQFIVAKGAKIECAHSMVITALLEGGTVNYITGGTVNDIRGGTVDNITGGTVNYITGGTVNYITDGTVNDIRGGTVDDITGGTVNYITGGTVDDIRGGTVNYITGGTVDDIRGGTVNYITGGTVNYITGGTVNYITGGTVNDIRGGTVDDIRGGTVNYITGGTVNDIRGGTVDDITGGTVLTITNMWNPKVKKIRSSAKIIRDLR